MPYSLWPHGLQHTRLPYSLHSPRFCSNSCPLSWWCHPMISSFVATFSSCPRFFLASGSFQRIGLLHQVGKVMELQLQHLSFQWIFRVDFILDQWAWSPCCPRDSQETSTAPQFDSSSSSMLSFLYGPTLTSLHNYWKQHNNNNNNIALAKQTFVSQVISLLFNTVSRFVIYFLPRWLFSRSVVSNCWRPHWMQYSRLNCPLLSPRIWTNSCPNLHQKYVTLKDEPPRLVCVQYATGEEWRNSSRKNEEVEQKQKQCPVVDVTGDERKVQSCTDQYCIGTWIVRFMSQGKLNVVKQEIERVNIDILGISELKWTRMGDFNSDDHCIYYCGQGSLRRSRAALIVKKRAQNAVFECSFKDDRMILIPFKGKPFNITVIQVYVPNTNAKEAEVELFYDDLKSF